jgi:alpha-ribazole phosphatase
LIFKVDARLVEMDFGRWEGQRWDAIPRAELDSWTANFASHACGGGESVQQVMARVAAAWDEACDQVSQPTAWITHAGVIRVATLLAQGQRQIIRADQWPQAAPAFGGWCQLPFPSSRNRVPGNAPTDLEPTIHSDEQTLDALPCSVYFGARA